VTICWQRQLAPGSEGAVLGLKQRTEALEDNDVLAIELSRLRKRLACQGGVQVEGTGHNENRVLNFFSYLVRIGIV
jgi:regulator of replication initiation timing